MTGFQSFSDSDHSLPILPMALDAGQDPVEHYFECISTCSIDDGACVTACVEVLRETP